MKLFLTLLGLTILFALQAVEYVKWRKGQISLTVFLRKLSLVLLLTLVLPLPMAWKLWFFLPIAIALGVISALAKHRGNERVEKRIDGSLYP